MSTSTKKIKKIHLVWGTSGDYSDRADWNIKVYKSKEKAEAHAKTAQEKADEYMKAHRWDYDSREFAELMKDLDPVARLCDGIQYGTQEIDYEG